MSDNDKPTLPPGASQPPDSAPAAQELAKAVVDQSQSMQSLINAFEDFTKKIFPGSIRGIHKGIGDGFKSIHDRVDDMNVKIDAVAEKYDRRIGWLEENFGELAADVGELARHVEALAEDIEKMKIERSSDGRSHQPS